MYTSSLKLTLAASLIGAFFLSANAFAARTSLHGSSCTNYFANQAGSFAHSPIGTYNTTATPSYTLCPLTVTHTSTTTAGSVFVRYNTPVAFVCTVFSYTAQGVYLSSVNATTGVGQGELVFSSVLAAPTTSHSVLCNLPQNGYIQSIEAVF